MTCALEDVGFEIRDCLMWLYGSGFPKSHDVGKAIDRHLGGERQVIGISDALRGRKSDNNESFGQHIGNQPVNQYADGYPITEPATPEASKWQGWGTALKPAYEPIVLARKPLIGTVAENVLKHGTGGINVDGCRIGLEEIESGRNGRVVCESVALHKSLKGTNTYEKSIGRWPSNLLLGDVRLDVLSLDEHLNTGIAQVILDYYVDYKLPRMWDRVRDLPLSSKGREEQVLFPRMLCKSSQQENEGAGAFHVRQTPFPRGGCQDDGDQERIRQDAQRHQFSDIQRQMGEQWVHDNQPDHIATRPREGSEGNAHQRPFGGSRAQSNNGCSFGQATSKVGGSSSSERSQERQSPRELGDDGQFNSQDGAQRYSQGTSDFEARKRTLEVLVIDVPDGWLKYFVPTGYSLRSPDSAVAMLDEQSGKLKSGHLRAGVNNKEKVRGMVYGEYHGYLNSEVESSTGGASRFFYIAKADRFEREAGLVGNIECSRCKKLVEEGQWPVHEGDHIYNDHPTVKPIELMRYLVRLVTPRNGLCLDPFVGSGTTLIADMFEGVNGVGIEKDAEKEGTIFHRLEYWKPIAEKRKTQESQERKEQSHRVAETLRTLDHFESDEIEDQLGDGKVNGDISKVH